MANNLQRMAETEGKQNQKTNKKTTVQNKSLKRTQESNFVYSIGQRIWVYQWMAGYMINQIDKEPTKYTAKTSSLNDLHKQTARKKTRQS